MRISYIVNAYKSSRDKMNLDKRVKLRFMLPLFLTVIIITSSITYVLSASPTIVIGPATGVSTASYIIYQEGSTYYARNGRTGAISYSSTNSSALFQSTFNGLTVGRTWKEKIIVKDSIIIPTTLLLPSYITLEIQGSLIASDGLDNSLIANIAGWGIDPYDAPPTRNTDIEICGGLIDGNKDGQSSPTDGKCTIAMHGVDNLYIHNIIMIDGWTENIRTSFADNVIITNNMINRSADDGIAINKLTSNAIVTNNIVSFAGLGVSYGAPVGIEIQDGSYNVIVANNYIYNCSSGGIQVSTHTDEPICHLINIYNNIIDNGPVGIAISGVSGRLAERIIVSANTITNTTSSGITASYLTHAEITNNFVSTNYFGLRIYYTNSYLKVSNNIFYRNDLMGMYIHADSSYIDVSQNKFIDNGNSEAGSQIGLGVYGDYNDVKNNVFEDTRSGADRTQMYGIYFYSGGDNNNVKYNLFRNQLTAHIGNDGSGNIMKYNEGYVTENLGSSTGTGAQQTIAHGLAGTPDYVFFSDIEIGADAYQSASADATNIYVTATVNQDYAWNAIYEP